MIKLILIKVAEKDEMFCRLRSEKGLLNKTCRTQGQLIRKQIARELLIEAHLTLDLPLVE